MHKENYRPLKVSAWIHSSVNFEQWRGLRHVVHSQYYADHVMSDKGWLGPMPYWASWPVPSLSFEVSGQIVVVTGHFIYFIRQELLGIQGHTNTLMKILEFRGTNEKDFSRDISPQKKPVTNQSKIYTHPVIKFTVSEFDRYQLFSSD